MPPDQCLSVSPTELGFFDCDAWDDLLNPIEEKRVIAVDGSELLKVSTEAGLQNLYTWHALRLAAKLGVPVPSLNDLVVRFLDRVGRRGDAYTWPRSVLRVTTFAPPSGLLAIEGLLAEARQAVR